MTFPGNQPGWQPYGHQQPHGQQQPYGQQSQYYQQQSPYGMPPMPGLPAQQRPVPPRPNEVTVSFVLWLAAVAFALLAAVLTFTVLDFSHLPGMPPAGTAASGFLKSMIKTSITVGIIFGVIADGVWVLFIFKMRAGANWARITMAAIGGVSLLSGVFSLVIMNATPIPMMHLPAYMWIVSGIEYLLFIVASVFMFRPKANAWFQLTGR